MNFPNEIINHILLFITDSHNLASLRLVNSLFNFLVKENWNKIHPIITLNSEINLVHKFVDLRIINDEIYFITYEGGLYKLSNDTFINLTNFDNELSKIFYDNDTLILLQIYYHVFYYTDLNGKIIKTKNFCLKILF